MGRQQRSIFLITTFYGKFVIFRVRENLKKKGVNKKQDGETNRSSRFF